MIDTTLSIQNHLFTHVHVSAIPAHTPDENTTSAVQINSEITLSLDRQSDGMFSTQLHVKVNPEADTKFPYSIDIACFCRVSVDTNETETERANKAVRAGHDMMFPAIRELVLSITSRQPWGPFSIGLGSLELPSEADPARQRTMTPAPKRIRRKSSAA